MFSNYFTVKQINKKAKHIGLGKSAEYRKKNCIDDAGRKLPGSTSWNKGRKLPSRGRTLETQFKPGRKPKNWKPVGSTRTTRDGYTEIKIAEGLYMWRPLHRENWKKKYGKYPPRGHAILFIDGNKQNCSIDNLKLVTRKELMLQNSVQNLPQTLRQAIQLTGVIRRKINDQTKRCKHTA